MKILTVVGARPQFIKAAPVSEALRGAGQTEFLVHTGQHYDHHMSQVFFDEMGIHAPDLNLEVGSGAHGRQTGQMLERLEAVMQAEKPDCTLVYGDTNSTLAGALAAAKLGIPIAHVESGLRSFNRSMPEEHNRVLTDHCSDILLCPTQTAVDNLLREGISTGVHLVGDTMADAVLQFEQAAGLRSTILQELRLGHGDYVLATVHRPYNTDVPERMCAILAALEQSKETVVFPVHPRTRQKMFEAGWRPTTEGTGLLLIEPVGYLDMLELERNAAVILTDSGGIQKEAYLFGVPCVTLRPETEWVETVTAGWNVLADADTHSILEHIADPPRPPTIRPPLFGDGRASQRIADIIGRITD